MASIFNYPKFKAFTSTGVPLSAGLLYSYEPGTNTPKATYLDINKVTAHTNPVQLDSNGEAAIYLDGVYKFILKDSSGSTLWTLDSVAGITPTASSIEVDATNYGTGDFTKDTIDAALAAIGATNKMTLLLRPGTWVISSNADWSAYTNVTFKIVPGVVISHGAFTVNIPNVDAGLYQVFSGTGAVTISGNVDNVYPEWWTTNTTPGTTSMSLAIQNALKTGKRTVLTGTYLSDAMISVSSVSNVELYGLPGSEIKAYDVASVVYFDTVTGLKVSGVKITRYSASKAFSIGIDLHDCTEIHITNNDISGATRTPTGGIIGAIYLDNARRIWIENNYLHGNGDGVTNGGEIITYNTQSYFVHVKDNVIVGSDTTFGVYLNASNSLVGGNYIDQGNTAIAGDNNGYGITFYGTSMEKNRIIGNTITNCYGTGIYLLGNQTEIVVSNNILNDVAKSQAESGLAVGGIVLSSDPGGIIFATITGNTIDTSGKDGICLNGTSHVTVSGNSIYGTGRGIDFRGVESDITVIGNSVDTSVSVGIGTFNSSSSLIRGTITGNTVMASSAQGISVHSATDCVITGNVISSTAQDGILLSAGSGNVISNNRITGVAANYSIHNVSTNDYITNNHLTGNSVGYLYSASTKTEGEVLLSKTTLSLAADGDTALYTVPAGYKIALTKAILVVGSDAGGTTISIGQNGAETEFVATSTLTNLNVDGRYAILTPIPAATPLASRVYSATTVIDARVGSHTGGATNYLYLYGTIMNH